MDATQRTSGTGHDRSVLTLALCAAIVLSCAAAATAGIVVDGRFDPAEGYTTGYAVDFDIEGGPTATGGQLWVHQDSATGDAYLAFTLPKTLVDNSYGSTSIGWGADAPSGKGHKFKDLTGSDKAQFLLTDPDGATLFNVTMDYLHGLGDKKEDAPYEGGDTADGKEYVVAFGNPDHVLAASTSLAYNWDTFGADYPEYFGKGADSPAAGPDRPRLAQQARPQQGLPAHRLGDPRHRRHRPRRGRDPRAGHAGHGRPGPARLRPQTPTARAVAPRRPSPGLAPCPEHAPRADAAGRASRGGIGAASPHRRRPSVATALLRPRGRRNTLARCR